MGETPITEAKRRHSAGVPKSATVSMMHGSSSVPQEWLAIICAHGGDIKETYDVPVEESSAASRAACAR
jgi:hypothetical protein